MPPFITMKDSTKKALNVDKIHKTFAGGQKYVFIATRDNAMCAIKMFKYGFGEREERELEFYKANENLIGIPKIIDVIDEDGDTIVVEEYIEGDCLQDVIPKYANSAKTISKLITEIADIMRPIWSERKIHRDLKPLNIIVTPDGSPVVIDFGIFKDPALTTITDTGIQPNTWMFAAPEQLLGNKAQISYRTDFFSLGVIAYLLYFQALPFGNKRDDVLSKITAHDLSYTTEPDCGLTEFFEATLQFDVSMRCRNVELIKEALLNK